MNLETIMAKSPYLEVLIRHAYWHFTPLIQWYSRYKNSVKKVPARISSQQLIDYFASRGIGRGDLLLLHSSFSALRAEKETPEEVISRLIEFLGPEGTLAMPAIPRHADAPDVTQLMRADVSKLILDYDPLTTPVWTGALPEALCRYPGAIRSLHPLNTMVAHGPLAKPMMANNLKGDKPLPCGRQSAWYFCYRHGAKVVAVGADLAHSLTMIHVAEDMWDGRWSVSGWYRERTYRIHAKDVVSYIVVRERHPKWAMHYAERTLSRDLLRQRIATKADLNGVNVETVAAMELVDYLNDRNDGGYPYFGVKSVRSTPSRTHKQSVKSATDRSR